MNITLFKLPNYSSINQSRGSGNSDGGLAIFGHNNITYIVRKDLSTNSKDIEALFTEIINVGSKNTLVNTSYRQLVGRYSKFEIYLKQFLCKSKN